MSSLQYSQPPRQVPLSLRITNFFNLGSQIGWGIFGFGMIFFWVFTWTADYSFINFRGPHLTTVGKVTQVIDTSASENRRRIYSHHYEYFVDGVTYNATSYASGDETPVGTEVTVEYDAGNPARSRIAGMRRGMFGPAVLFVVIFPLVGLAILIVSTRVGLKRNHLLRDGIFTTGVLKARRPTNMTVNRRRVFELIFEFTARDGRRCEASANTSFPAKLEDEAQEPLLYDPENPSIAYLLDEAPSRPKLEMNGELAGNPAAAGASLILPVLVAGAHGLVAFFKLKSLF